jgi:endonuclease YncB( thermonuclease family)
MAIVSRVIAGGAFMFLAAATPSLAGGVRAADGAAAAAATATRPYRAQPGIVAEGERFTCTPTRVWDGDGPVWCAEGPRIRLSGIATREMDGSCRSNQPCPAASAEAARDYLARLLGSPAGADARGHILLAGAAPLSCLSLGSGKGKRTAAWCSSPRIGDVSCRMVASGLALRWDVYWKDHGCSRAPGSRRLGL